MSSILLKVDSLSLITQNGVILQNLSFEIHQGEILALTGQSGSGKTSIALALLGLLPTGIIQKGSFDFFTPERRKYNYPADAASWSSLRGRHIGYIQQDVFGAFDPIMRMGKQMLLIIKERAKAHYDNHEIELRNIMTEVGLADVERIWKSYPHQLSGGQLQRCLLCLSIVMSPSLLIADEPTSALDKITQVELLDNLSLIRKKYTMGILCISHESSVVKYLADREVKLEETPIALSNTHVRSKNTQAKTLLTVVDLGYNHHYGGLIQKRGDKISEIKFSLSAGECLGIIGESGSGKSTIAQMLVAHLIPNEGRIELDGNFIDFKNQDEIRSLRSRVQLVMQDGRGSLHPDKLTGELMHEIVAQQIKSKDTKQIILNALHEVGLPAHVLDRKAGNLSGGECLRISIARALLMNPEILICDESTSALDEATRDGIMNLLTGLIENRQLGLILISHDSTVIKNMADKIIVLSNGKIVEAGDMRAIIANPSHDVTKKILSAEATLSEKSPL